MKAEYLYEVFFNAASEPMQELLPSFEDLDPETQIAWDAVADKCGESIQVVMFEDLTGQEEDES